MPTTLDTSSSETDLGSIGVTPGAADVLSPPALERRGLWWLLWSFLLCPCHLPLSLGVLTALFAGTSLGAAFRDHTWVAGTLLTVTWLAGTAYGFHLIRQAKRAGGACPTRTSSTDGCHRRVQVGKRRRIVVAPRFDQSAPRRPHGAGSRTRSRRRHRPRRAPR